MNRFKISCKRLFYDESLILNYRNVKKLFVLLWFFNLIKILFRLEMAKTLSIFLRLIRLFDFKKVQQIF